MKHQGSCHCGKIKFEADGDIQQVMECNCSICSRKAAKMWFVPREKLKLLTPESASSTYKFNKHVISHKFCSTCGIHAWGEGSDPKGNRMAMVNVRCLEGVDYDALPVKHFDGRAL
jgi:hypothetical protein